MIQSKFISMMNSSRVLAGIEVLKEGEAFLFENLQLQLNGDTVSVRGWTNTIFLENLTKAKAIEEITETKKDYKNLLIGYPLLEGFLKEKTPTFSLNYDTGKAGISICKEVSGGISWDTNLKE
jgi:hypothetical protein